MATSIEEQRDLTALHTMLARERENFSMRCQYFLSADSTVLQHSGHKSVEAALIYATHRHKKALEQLLAAHMKKWPD